MIERREVARKENWAMADRIRNQLVDIGIILEDGPEGTIWKINH